MSKKYKLVSDKITEIQEGGNIPFTFMPPVVPMINPFTSQIQVANPVLPTVQPTFNVYPRPMTLGPKINIFPNAPVVPIMSRPCVQNIQKPMCGEKVFISNPCPKKKCDIDLVDLLANTNKYKYKYNSSILSPLSDDLPPIKYFRI